MSTEDENADLPVLRGDADLPIIVPGSGPYHERAHADAHPGWFNLASQCHTRDLAVDSSKGEVWLATGGGVLRWAAGLNCFTRYASEHGLPGNAVAAVAIDGKSQVWVAHESFGVSYLGGHTWRSYAALSEVTVSCLSRDSIGRLWAGSERGVYAITSPSKRPSVELPSPGEPPRAMSVTGKDEVWLCNTQGVFHFASGDWVRYSVRPDVLTLIHQDGNLWLGTLDGLTRIALATGEVHQSDTWPRGEVTALAPSPEGVWAVCGGQVGLATETGWIPISKQRLGRRVTGVVAAEDGGVWIGTHDGLLHGSSTGIDVHLTDTPPDVIGVSDARQFSTPFSNMIQALAVQALATGPVLWIGTASSLFRLDVLPERWVPFPDIRDVRTLVAGAVKEDVWVASWSSSVYNLKGQTVQKHNSGLSLPLLAFAEGYGTGHWAAGLDGLYRSDGLTWALAVPASRLPERSRIRAVTQVQPARVWMGTSGGLYVYHPDTGGLRAAGGPLGSHTIRALLSILKGKNEQLWVGTDRGLYGGKPDNLKPIPGLEDQVVTALAWDSTTSILWAGTLGGLFCVTEKSDEWMVKSMFTVWNSGLAADRVTALALGARESGQKNLWVGTPCGLSCYTY